MTELEWTDSFDRYADPVSVARRQLSLLRSWGVPLPAPASVLEIGCADGLSTAGLVEAGYQVTGLDYNPQLIATARRRVGDLARLVIADVNAWVPEQTYDAVLGLMWEFFNYVIDPGAVLKRLRSATRSKLIIDVNPRTHSISYALDVVRDAGFRNVAWRPLFLPQSVRLSTASAAALRALEGVRGARSLVLRRKFVAVIKGEP